MLKRFFFAAVVVPFSVSPLAHATQVVLGGTDLSASSGQDDFVFTNNGTSATWTTIPGGAAANFYLYPSSVNGSVPPQLSADVPVHIFLNATTSTAGGSIFSGALDVQPIDSGTMQVLLDTPINGLDNVLTVQFTNGSIYGSGSTPSFDVQDGLDQGTATYTSDFLNFSGSTTGNNFSFGSSNANPELSFDGNFLASFTENGLSTFTYDNANETVTAVPEPASLSLLALGAPLLMKRRRRAEA